ncbi:hypothetical protein ICN48_05515 [Polynucleobacter sp. JS-Safj-400b-B2]|uniref:hypothetical protein n=1 Tax=Polynucleobacter sp. JS-Safj-400b-B2 TaxID=2576921 RepID=UPI001C0AFC9A|nr:hypothetical protein [Polynucleobacter sp. JS-Safj-400b-B2]MBU3625692.1 hypothetical protein [Polynucleobacter sp. JS-Safj-400b-B2]
MNKRNKNKLQKFIDRLEIIASEISDMADIEKDDDIQDHLQDAHSYIDYCIDFIEEAIKPNALHTYSEGISPVMAATLSPRNFDPKKEQA